MLAEPRLILLDEATSAVDPRTEERLTAPLARLLAGRTSLVVAHRLSTIRHADLVLVMDGGRILERGTHDALLATPGAYERLYGQFVA
jgi:ABC-type multidrug transport system fused ATPase/permease subunit